MISVSIIQISRYAFSNRASLPPFGRRLDLYVTDGIAKMPLADVAAGSCRLVVVTSYSCPAGKAQAHSWAVAAARMPAEAIDPSGWTVLWLAVENVPDTVGYFGTAFHWPVYYSVVNHQLNNAGWLTAFPSQLVLDGDGNLIQLREGGRMPQRAHFAQDCTLLDTDTR
jgi:hypothetical protein